MLAICVPCVLITGELAAADTSTTPIPHHGPPPPACARARARVCARAHQRSNPDLSHSRVSTYTSATPHHQYHHRRRSRPT